MRKITSESVAAFLNGEKFNKGNTQVVNHGQVTELRLHGNLIAERVHETGEVFIRDAGWQSVTTKERLNGVCVAVLGRCMIHQKNWQWYYNDELWNGESIVINGGRDYE